MKIYISEDDYLQNIQKQFHAVYPFLKLEFFRQTHSKGQGTPITEKLSPSLPIEDVRMFHTHAWIDIDKSRTVAALETDFHDRLGLNVQVMRMSGNVWMETTLTDSWTLEKQNEEGKASVETRMNNDIIEKDLQDVS